MIVRKSCNVLRGSIGVFSRSQLPILLLSTITLIGAVGIHFY